MIFIYSLQKEDLKSLFAAGAMRQLFVIVNVDVSSLFVGRCFWKQRKRNVIVILGLESINTYYCSCVSLN